MAETYADRPTPASLRADRALSRSWHELSERTQAAAAAGRACSVNDALERAAGGEPQAPTAPAFRLWRAENLAREQRHAEALHAFDAAVDATAAAPPLVPGVDFRRVALHHQAASAAVAGQLETALRRYDELSRFPGGAEAGLEGGLLAEAHGKRDAAARLYQAVAEESASPATDVPGQLARRAYERLQLPDEAFAPHLAPLADAVATALEERDARRLDALLSRTHFAVGPRGGHFRFEDDDLRERLLRALVDGIPQVRRTLLGIGEKRSMPASGWSGELLQGDLLLALTRAPRGWQWTGVVVTLVTDAWLERWRPAELQKNQPLPFALRAPWPAGVHMMAGGLVEFGVKLGAVLALGGLAGGLLALGFARSGCGFGPRGSYYNQGLHDDESAFAIDFTRFRHGVPFDPESGGVAVLAPRAGVVVAACGTRPSGSSSASNTVELMHPDPATGADRFLSRYLHLAGPNLLSVSTGMAVILGQRLGRINDTGNSSGDHLHFSIHDQDVDFPGAGSGCGGITRGASVRPSPMEGRTLGDGASGTCILSSNRERRPPPPDDAEFVSQQVPSSLRPLERAQVAITMRNSGPTTWTAGYTLVSLALGWNVDEVPIGRSVDPGEEVRVEFEVLSLGPGDLALQWRMARPFTGPFGEATPRVAVEVRADDGDGGGGGGDPCPGIEDALASAEAELRSWQDLLKEVPPSAKPEIVDQIQSTRARIAGLQAQAQRLGCA